MKCASVIILLICLVANSCKTKDVVSPDEYEGNKLILSHGGGFAGKYKTYCLLDNGQLFKSAKQFEANDPVVGLKKEAVNQIFSNYETLGLGNVKMQSYGNLNYSITMVSENGDEHKLIWEKGQIGTENLQLYYRNIMNQIRLRNKDNAKPQAAF